MNLSSLTSSSSALINPSPLISLSSNRPSLRPIRVSVISCSTATATINGNNFYKMLSLSPEIATMAEIKRAYRSMALRYHPDVCRDASMKEEWTRMFVELNAAYETLSNPRLREEYDCQVLGLGRRMSRVGNDESERLRKKKWEEQVVELRNRSNRRMGHKARSWGSSMRAQRMKNHN